MLFLPNDDALEAQAKAIIDEVVAAEGLSVLGYRQVPVAPEVVGRFAKATQPRIWQVGVLVSWLWLDCGTRGRQQDNTVGGCDSKGCNGHGFEYLSSNGFAVGCGGDESDVV